MMASSELEMEEEREVGAVSWGIYGCYLRAMGSWWWVVLIGFSLVAEQGATVGNALFLGFWSQGKIEGFSQGEYMIVYAGEFTLIIVSRCLWVLTAYFQDLVLQSPYSL
jgi:ATP-binding cassette subfamily C (CFTR/MRP) protein 1